MAHQAWKVDNVAIHHYAMKLPSYIDMYRFIPTVRKSSWGVFIAVDMKYSHFLRDVVTNFLTL